MTVYELQILFSQYGMFIVAFLVFMEYLAIPGYPGGATLPMVGVMAQFGIFSFWEGFVASVAAATVAFTCIYWMGFLFNATLSRFFSRKEKLQGYFIKANTYIEKHGNTGILISRMTPLVRAFISVPAGILKMNFAVYTLYSILGTGVYVLGTMALGYFVTGLFV